VLFFAHQRARLSPHTRPLSAARLFSCCALLLRPYYCTSSSQRHERRYPRRVGRRHLRRVGRQHPRRVWRSLTSASSTPQGCSWSIAWGSSPCSLTLLALSAHQRLPAGLARIFLLSNGTAASSPPSSRISLPTSAAIRNRLILDSRSCSKYSSFEFRLLVVHSPFIVGTCVIIRYFAEAS
jgi:hypothetical protein